MGAEGNSPLKGAAQLSAVGSKPFPFTFAVDEGAAGSAEGKTAGQRNVNRCSVVTVGKPKVLIGLGQKGMWPGWGARTSPHADVAPPAYEAGPNLSGC